MQYFFIFKFFASSFSVPFLRHSYSSSSSFPSSASFSSNPTSHRDFPQLFGFCMYFSRCLNHCCCRSSVLFILFTSSQIATRNGNCFSLCSGCCVIVSIDSATVFATTKKMWLSVVWILFLLVFLLLFLFLATADHRFIFCTFHLHWKLYGFVFFDVHSPRAIPLIVVVVAV